MPATDAGKTSGRRSISRPRFLSPKSKHSNYSESFINRHLLHVIHKYTLSEECRLRVLENRFLRRIFRPKKDANGEWRSLHNEELHSLYRLSNIVRSIKSRRLRWVGHVVRIKEGSSSFKILIGRPTPIGKRPLGRLKGRLEDNIRINLKEIGINTRNLFDSAQDRDYWRALVNVTFHLWVP